MAGMINDFDGWLPVRIREGGPFTALVVLVAIGERNVDLLRSSYVHVIGDEITWTELERLFAGAGVDWNGVALFEGTTANGPGLVPDPEARRQLADTVERVREERLVLNEGHFFDRQGRRLHVEEATTH